MKELSIRCETLAINKAFRILLCRKFKLKMSEIYTLVERKRYQSLLSSNKRIFDIVSNVDAKLISLTCHPILRHINYRYINQENIQDQLDLLRKFSTAFMTLLNAVNRMTDVSTKNKHRLKLTFLKLYTTDVILNQQTNLLIIQDLVEYISRLSDKSSTDVEHSSIKLIELNQPDYPEQREDNYYLTVLKPFFNETTSEYKRHAESADESAMTYDS
jgi:hypothetical protein